MRQQSSISAQGIAIVRAIESAKPEGERVCYDPYARQMVSNWMYGLVKFFYDLGYGERRGPGVMEFLVARERYIDDCLQTSLESGLQQLVILGAGLDTRPYRFPALKTGVKIFEVDHPASQVTKVKKLEQIFGQLPEHVSFVAVDFTAQSLASRLFESGYSRQLRTLFIWQGVTQYLNPTAVDQTLAFIAHNSPGGSQVVFDYMYSALLKDTTDHGEIRNLRRYRRFSGEDLTFGIPQGSVVAYLEQRGFTRVVDVDHTGLQKAYFQSLKSPRKVASGYAIALATVK